MKEYRVIVCDIKRKEEKRKELAQKEWEEALRDVEWSSEITD
jgi:hypothetical protein